MYKSVHDIFSSVRQLFSKHGLTGEDFLVLTDQVLLNKLGSLSDSQGRRLAKFVEMAPSASMYDLSQNPEHRLRIGGDAVLTLTKTCSSIWVCRAERCFCFPDYAQCQLSTTLFF